jgi:hypothetical protein
MRTPLTITGKGAGRFRQPSGDSLEDAEGRDTPQAEEYQRIEPIEESDGESAQRNSTNVQP